MLLGSRYVRPAVCYFFPGCADVQVTTQHARPPGEYEFAFRLSGNDTAQAEARVVVTVSSDVLSATLL